jgi:hypothetical protein
MIIKIINDKNIKKIFNFRNWEKNEYLFFKEDSYEDFKDEIVIAPAAIEHYNLYEYLKLKIYCDLNKIKIIGFGNLNQFPYLSIFCHEFIMVKNKLEFYDGDFTKVGAGSKIIEVDPKFCNVLRKSDKCSWIFKHSQEKISNNEVIDIFFNLKICIRQSSLNTYYDLIEKKYLKKDKISCQISTTCGPGPVGIKLTNYIIENKNKFDLDFFNIDYTPCKKHLLKVGHHFMSHQILLSVLSNWQFISCGGSASLLTVIPTKLLCALDRNYNNIDSLSDDVKEYYKKFGENNIAITKGIYKKRYNKNSIPCLEFKKFNYNLINKIISNNLNYNTKTKIEYF